MVPGSQTTKGLIFDDAEAFHQQLPPQGRLIGIDAGTKTLGLALSDVTRIIASPLETIRRTKFSADSARLIRLADAHRAVGFVLGLPIHLDGRAGSRAQSVRALARNFAAVSHLPMLFWDERLSTAAAERHLIEANMSRQRRAEVVDKVAASLILQGALDRMRRLRV